MILIPKTREERLERGFRDPVWFNRFYLEEWFPDRVPWFHRGLMAIISRQADFLLHYGEFDKIARHFVWYDDNRVEHRIFTFAEDGTSVRMEIAPNSNFILPRGFSKTTIVNASNLRDQGYKLSPYILYISESATHSSDQLTTIRREWEDNALLINDFGVQAADRQDARRWTNDIIETQNGCIVRAVGRGGQIRGKAFRAKRPNKIICDDIEDEESVLSDVQRRKTRNWYYSAVVPALPAPGRRKPTDCIINLGTLLGSECLLVEVSRDPTFNTVVLGALDRDQEPLWPEHMSLADIERERDQARRTGTLSIFSREKLSTIRQDEDAPFRADHIIHADLDPTQIEAVSIALDPAISDKKDSDLTAIGVTAKDSRGRTWVLDLWSGRGVHPREQIDKFFELRNRWRTIFGFVQFAGVETVAFQKALIFLFQEEMARRNDYFEILPITHGNVNKLTRILGVLQPRYAASMMRHARHFPSLEATLLDFPNGKLDEIDVIAMAVSLLEPFSRLAADGPDPAEQNDYEPLPLVLGCP